MFKKKSKFRHITINKKKYYFYKIKWQDILGDSGHSSAKEFDSMKPNWDPRSDPNVLPELKSSPESHSHSNSSYFKAHQFQK